MSEKTSTIYVCTNIDCKSRGAVPVLEKLESRLQESGALSEAFEVKPYICFSACNCGPNVVIPDRRSWLSGVSTDDIDDIVEYLAGGDTVQRLQGKNSPELEEMIFSIIDAGLIPDV